MATSQEDRDKEWVYTNVKSLRNTLEIGLMVINRVSRLKNTQMGITTKECSLIILNMDLEGTSIKETVLYTLAILKMVLDKVLDSLRTQTMFI